MKNTYSHALNRVIHELDQRLSEGMESPAAAEALTNFRTTVKSWTRESPEWPKDYLTARGAAAVIIKRIYAVLNDRKGLGDPRVLNAVEELFSLLMPECPQEGEASALDMDVNPFDVALFHHSVGFQSYNFGARDAIEAVEELVLMKLNAFDSVSQRIALDAVLADLEKL